MQRTSETRGWLVGLFAASLLLRLVHLWTVHDLALFRLLYIDPRMYDEWGLAIARGQLVGPAPFFLDPLYPYLIGAIYAVAGRSLIAVALVQCVLGALVAPLMFDAARRWFPRPVAGIAGVVAAVYPPSIYYSVVLLKPGVALFFVTLALWTLARAMERNTGPLRWLGCGVALGLAVLTRNNLLLVVPWLALVVLLDDGAVDHDGERGRRRDWRPAAALLGGTLLALLPATVHNAVAGKEPILATTNWGQIFFIGNNADNPTGRFRELPFVRSNPAFEQIDFKTEAERRAGRTLRHGEVSRFWFGEGLEWAATNPAGWLRLQWSKLRIYWGGYETPASLDYYLYSRQAPLLALQLPAFGLLGPFGLLGTALAFGRRGWPRLLAVYTAGASLSVVLFFVLTRFRMVIVPALAVLAAFALVEWVGSLRAARRDGAWRRALLLTGLLLLGFVFVNLPVRAPADRWPYRVAAAVGLPTRLESTANAHFNLGVTHAARDELAEAETELRAAIAEEPFAKYSVELGKVLARAGRNEEAIAAYRDAVRADPFNYRNHHALGLLYGRIGDAAAAERAYREALRLEPRHTASAVKLGELLLEQGRTDEAAEAFRYALRLNPRSESARAGLARAEGRR